jgi:phenylalanyl-tRNA synthetase alpha chain
MQDIITKLEHELRTSLKTVTQPDALEALRVAFLGRNGHIAKLMQELKDLPLESKRAIGPEINRLKQLAETECAQRAEELVHATIRMQQEKQRHFDVTATIKPALQGSLHVYTRTIEQLENIFISMGYDVVEGPEIETDFYNFEALNIPADHPAREEHDTFWISDGRLLRTHTSPVQVRALEQRGTPLAIFAPGRTYRHEATDASHDFMFMQGELLYVDKQVSISNLLATAQTFLKAFFQTDHLNVRARPGYFPFVEPGIEIDASCPFCTGGCSICKKTGWIELLGSGLVHPHVLRSCGIDPEIYSGFALGFGIERLAMVKYGINDIRLFHGNNIEFLEQF